MKEFPLIYALINNDDAVRKESSSGGVFYALAEYVINKSGVVFGAKFNESWGVEHGYATDIAGIKAFMGSKYVQSSTKSTFKEAKALLEEGKTVLYSGTPCQIYGLKAFLKKEYDNLITVDFVCHGVPSPLVWKKYLEYVSDGKTVTSIEFRNKDKGWQNYYLKITYANEEFNIGNVNEDMYLKGFLTHIYLRPSCHNCEFKGVKRISDITLADMWGCKSLLPDMFDDKGASLVFIQSAKGKEIFEQLATKFKSKQLTDNAYQKHNPAINVSSRASHRRKAFFKNVSAENIKKQTRPDGFIIKIFKKTKRLIKRVLKK